MSATNIFTPLPHLGLIAVSGVDAAKFLQGQVTCDVREVTAEQSRLGAWCNPKGRIQATFRLLQDQGTYYLQLPRSMIPQTIIGLQKYAVFFKTQLADVSPQWVQTDLSESATVNACKLSDILAGIPTIYPETAGEFTPHQLNYQLINGVSFNKGCYTGQEIVARMHYLGKPKQQMYRVSFTAEQNFPPNTKLYLAHGAEAREVGNLINVALEHDNHYQALAVLQNSVIGETIAVENPSGAILQVLDLPYTT